MFLSWDQFKLLHPREYCTRSLSEAFINKLRLPFLFVNRYLIGIWKWKVFKKIISISFWINLNINLSYKLCMCKYYVTFPFCIQVFKQSINQIVSTLTRSIQRTQKPSRLWPLTLSCDLDLKLRSNWLMSLDVAYCIVPWYHSWCLWV